MTLWTHLHDAVGWMDYDFSVGRPMVWVRDL